MDYPVGSAAALFSASIWAYSTTMMTGPSRRFGGRPVNLFKSALAAGLFAITTLAWCGPSAFRIPGAAATGLCVSGFVGLALGDSFYYTTLRNLGPGVTTVLYQMSAPFTLALSAVVLDERFGAVQGVGIALVIGGVTWTMLAKHPRSAEGGNLGLGVAAGIASALCQAAGLVLAKRALHSLDAAAILANATDRALVGATLRLSAAFVGLILPAMIGSDRSRQVEPLVTRDGWRLLTLPSFLGTFLGIFAMQVAVDRLPNGIASVLLSTTPIFVIPIAWKVLGDRPSGRAIAGAIAAIFGVAMLSIDPAALDHWLRGTGG